MHDDLSVKSLINNLFQGWVLDKNCEIIWCNGVSMAFFFFGDHKLGGTCTAI